MMPTPPFKITPTILGKCQAIGKELGLISGRKLVETSLQLRRTNTIKSIQASLAIEGNTLTFPQITALIEGKRVIGSPREITEVKNALDLYEDRSHFNPLAIQDLLKAHHILMKNLIADNGQWRAGDVGILKGNNVSHVAPPAKRVPILMQDLFNYINQASDLSWLIKACLFHYEFEFIHPFSDGNGRLGRFWQQLLLMREDPTFEAIPIELLIKENQEQYYKVLEQCDSQGESTLYIEFALNLIHLALQDYARLTPPLPHDYKSRLEFARNRLQAPWFSRKDYLNVYQDISQATASRDLIMGLQAGLLVSKGEKNQKRYAFIDSPH